MNSPSKIKKNADVLVAWYERHKPQVNHITLADEDYDVICAAQPRTLKKHGFWLLANGIAYRGFTLTRKTVKS